MRLRPGFAIVVALATLAGTARAQDGARFEDASAWPRSFEEGGAKFTIYQPRIEKWDGARLLTRAVVAVETASAKTFGAVWIVARAEGDDGRRVVLDRFAIARASFPSAPERSDAWLAALRAHAPTGASTLELSRIEESLAVLHAKEKAPTPALGSDPPRIFFSDRPALLLLVDGEPVLRQVGDSGLFRVINTRSLLLESAGSGDYFLAVGDRWLEAPTLDGPWSLATAPEGAETVKRDAVSAKLVDVRDDAAALGVAGDEGPVVYTSTKPAALIETSGEPAFERVADTSLLWARNANGRVFVDTTTDDYFVLVSGRWYEASSRAGPWSFVPAGALPADFARIPATHPAANVLASIPGTPQAAEAVFANDVPETTLVDRSSARLETSFDGPARFVPIEGTRLFYAANSTTPIVRVNDFFYACEDGVWFVAPTPDGPWRVADLVPPIVYTIPPSCPIYYVTHVCVYDSTPDSVSCGYTRGYLGSCVSHEGCVVWGTGFYHRPWIGRRWIGRPSGHGFTTSGRLYRGWTTRATSRAWSSPVHDTWRPPVTTSRTTSPAVRYSAPVRSTAPAVSGWATRPNVALQPNRHVIRPASHELFRWPTQERPRPTPIRVQNVPSGPRGGVRHGR